VFRQRHTSEKQVTNSALPSQQTQTVHDQAEGWWSNYDTELQWAQIGVGREIGAWQDWGQDKTGGYIEPVDGSETIYCHANDLLDDTVEKGDQVIYGKVWDERWRVWRCMNVKVARGDERVGVIRKKGIVKDWNNMKSFGFIQPYDGGQELFCHWKNLLDREASAQVGDEVTYEEEFNERARKFRCVQVRLLSRDRLNLHQS
jgi:cold shock CspA family protein